MVNKTDLYVWTVKCSFLISGKELSFSTEEAMLPAGAKGNLCSSSERSVLIRLLSEEARQCVLPERLSTLPPLERGLPGLNGSPWNIHKYWFNIWAFLEDTVFVWLWDVLPLVYMGTWWCRCCQGSWCAPCWCRSCCWYMCSLNTNLGHWEMLFKSTNLKLDFSTLLKWSQTTTNLYTVHCD